METQRQSMAHCIAGGDQGSFRITFPPGSVKFCHFSGSQGCIKKPQIVEEHVRIGKVHHLADLFFRPHIKGAFDVEHFSGTGQEKFSVLVEKVFALVVNGGGVFPDTGSSDPVAFIDA